MPIIRCKNAPVQISREEINDPRLSWTALGLWVYLCSLPESTEEIHLSSFPHKDANDRLVASFALEELVEAGYVVTKGGE